MSEFSVWVSLGLVATEPVEVQFEASETQRLETAKRLGVSEIISLKMDGKLERTTVADIYRVSGKMTLIAERTCIVTLENFIETTLADFDEYFTTSSEHATDQDDGSLVLADEEEVSLLEDDGIDIGELGLQHLVLALNPYPRGPDAPLADSDEASTEALKPFAGLKALLAKSGAISND